MLKIRLHASQMRHIFDSVKRGQPSVSIMSINLFSVTNYIFIFITVVIAGRSNYLPASISKINCVKIKG